MIGEDRHRLEPAPSPALPPEPGVDAPGLTAGELIDAELVEPEAAAREAELAEAYTEHQAAERAEHDAARERRMAGHHEREADEHDRDAERHRRAAAAHQRVARLDDPVTVDAEVVEADEADESAEPVESAEPAEPAEPAEGQLIRLEEAVDALPALVRVAAGAWLRAAAWGVGTSLRVGAQLARAATDPEAAVELYGEMSDGVRAYARDFLGVSDIDERVRQLTPLAGSTMRQDGDRPELDLRAQGEELLRQAADVDHRQTAHPAYARILTELSPDEARILRLLAIEGPQALVDVRAQNLIGLGSQLVTPGLNMVGAQAGVRWRDRVPAYLNNLGRLGLIYVSDEALGDPIAYQVLEAQPDVLGVIKDTPRAKTVHRSIRLTPFGQDFCSVCLPLDPVPAPSAPQLPSGGVEQAPLG